MKFRLRSLFLLTAVVAFATCVLFRWWPIDGVGGSLISFFCNEDTLWADGYSDDAFRTAGVGMTRGQIHALLGPPLEAFDVGGGNLALECWTISPADTHYRQREFLFRGDVAIEKRGEFWID